jgi:hypothetical protein
VGRNTTRRVVALLGLAASGGCGTDDAATNDTASDTDDFAFLCMGTLTTDVLALDSSLVAPLLQNVSGHHETSLFWERQFVTDAMRGFDERTTLALDVTVLEAEQTHYVPSAQAAAGCTEYYSYHLGTDVRLTTADGALDASFPHQLRCDDGACSSAPKSVLPIDGSIGQLELEADPTLGMDPTLESEANLEVLLAFGDDGLRGDVAPRVTWPRDDSELPISWMPAWGFFPGKWCLSSPVVMGEASAELEARVRDVYASLARVWPSEAVEASWVPASFAAPTEVTLELGPPSMACLDSVDYPTVFAPLVIKTADGSVDFSGELRADLYPDGRVQASANSPFASVSDFEEVAGVRGIDFGPARHGRVSLFSTFEPERETFGAGLRVEADSTVPRDSVELPMLTWCSGDGCSGQ